MDRIPKSHYELVKGYFNTLQPRYLETIREDVESITGPDPTYTQFVTTQMNTSEIPLDMQRDAALHCNVHYHLVQTLIHGERHYYIEKPLAIMLSQTEPNAEGLLLRSPHTEIFVQIPTGLFRITDTTGDPVPVCGFYVHCRDRDTIQELRIMAVSLLPATDKIPFNDSNFYIQLSIGPGNIGDQIREYIKNCSKNREEELKLFGGAANIEHAEEFLLFVSNVLLYITSRDPDLLSITPTDLWTRQASLKSVRKLRKLERKASRETSYTTIVAGSRLLPIPKETLELEQAGSIGAWKLTKKVRVSGHWRAQWYGSEKESTRRQENLWIKPYDKGPDMAELMNKKYVVKAS